MQISVFELTTVIESAITVVSHDGRKVGHCVIRPALNDLFFFFLQRLLNEPIVCSGAILAGKQT